MTTDSSVTRQLYAIYDDDPGSTELWKLLKSKENHTLLVKKIVDIALAKGMCSSTYTTGSLIIDFERLVQLDPKKIIVSKKWIECSETGSTTMLKKLPRVTAPVRHGMMFGNAFNYMARWNVGPGKHWTREQLQKEAPRFFKNEKTLATKPTCSRWRKIMSLKYIIPAQFRPGVARGIYALYNSKRILDTSAGWGNRLIAALADPHVTHYTGIDPSPIQHRIYQRILKFVQKNLPNNYRKTKVSLIKSGSEEVQLQRDFFDLAFTSPPYFDKEKYIAGRQSYLMFPTYDEWFDKFLVKTLNNTIRAVKPGGYIMLNMMNLKKSPMVSDILKYTSENKASDLEYIGAVGLTADPVFTTTRQSRVVPVLIWRRR